MEGLLPRQNRPPFKPTQEGREVSPPGRSREAERDQPELNDLLESMMVGLECRLGRIMDDKLNNFASRQLKHKEKLELAVSNEDIGIQHQEIDSGGKRFIISTAERKEICVSDASVASPNAGAELPGDAKGRKAPTAIDFVHVENEAVTITEASTTRGLVCVKNKAATVQEAPMARGLVHVGDGDPTKTSTFTVVKADDKGDQSRSSMGYRRDHSLSPVHQRVRRGHRGHQSQSLGYDICDSNHSPALHGRDRGHRRGHNGSDRRRIHC
ncbi:hypothetical protein PoB_001855900 [Plakobranchus ocellatus]|uniref:Uncharacterized protein n=1 Tax=Plakobranchus ocellatus TaxID=259542 RepID=A0AAV3Z9P6_9GAST|nr:hypothetical protein PoB_001855900 [Plakobranchus ocellatus]